MDRVVLLISSRSLKAVSVLKPFFPSMDAAELSQRLAAGLRNERDLDGPDADAAVRFLMELSHPLWTPEVEVRIHHLIDDEETIDDPLTQLDLTALGWMLELAGRRVNAWSDGRAQQKPGAMAGGSGVVKRNERDSA
jgi:hypothetical protein